MQIGARGRGGAGINLTPLIDVVLVLLIIFMVITPMAQSGREIELPRADAEEGDGRETEEPMVVTVDEGGGLWIEETAVDELTLRAAAGPRARVLLRGDARARVGDVRRALRALQSSGATEVALAVRGEGDSP